MGFNGGDALGDGADLGFSSGGDMSAFQFGRSPHRIAIRNEGFSSKLEKAVYIKLKDREILGEVTDIKMQQTVRLHDLATGEVRNWKVDFSCVDRATGQTIYVEAKGFEDREYIRKRNMWRKNPPGRLEIWRGTHRRPRLVEVIDPKGEQNE